MFAYCGNNPVKNVDYFGFFEVCFLDDPMNVNRAFITPAMFIGGSGYVADVSSSYYAQQNVRAYDSYWRNSNYNITSSGWTSSANQSFANGGNYQSPIPYPGNDSARCDVPGFSWRGSGDPGSNKGNFYNLQTGEWLHPDLYHPMPIGPHWDYGRHGSSEVYRVFPDGTMRLK